MVETLIFTVDQAGKNNRLDKFLSERALDYSRSRIKQLIEQGQVNINNSGIETIQNDPAFKLKLGMHITLAIPELIPTEMIAQPLPLDIVYEDEYLLMINKAAGMAVHPGPGNPDGTVVNAVLHHCNGQLSGIGGVERPGIVHRIDMDTSGLLVVAKDDNTHQHLSAQLKARTLKREYTAFVWGSFSQKSGMIEGHIGRSPTNRKKMAVVMRGGKEARTHYQVEERVMYNGSPFVSHITCQLETGRTHQIRVHCSHEGHSLVGDPVYGSCRKWPKTFPEKLLSALELFQRQALHARELQLIHPHTNQTMRFDAALPQDMANLWRLFKDLS